MMRQTFVSPEPTEPTDPSILLILFQRVPSGTTDSLLCVSFHNSFALNSLAYALPPASVGSVGSVGSVDKTFCPGLGLTTCLHHATVPPVYNMPIAPSAPRGLFYPSSTPFLKRYGHPAAAAPPRRPVPGMARKDIVKPPPRCCALGHSTI